MRIFIDIGHPAHVHYFRNFIKTMESEGHEFFISARNRSIIFDLLNKYKIKYYDRGKGKNSIIGKLIYLLKADIKLFYKAKKFKPDILISFASPYAAHAAWLINKPHIVFDDTEHARFNHFLYKSFSKVFMNPVCFKKNFGKKQILFDSYPELFYLHSKYNNSSPETQCKLPSKFALLRFISWNANHDLGHSGLDLQTKKDIINTLNEKGYEVLISSEAECKDIFFKKFLINFSPELIHYVMSQAEIVITEGATMASECAMLGTPVVYVNSLDAGTLRELEDKYQLIYGFRSGNGVLDKVIEIVELTDSKKLYQSRREKMLSEKIDITSFLIWFIENYPESIGIMRENPAFQYKIKL